mgnify:CR=1 FL=1
MSKPFKLNSAFRPSGDQPEAIRRLEEGLEDALAPISVPGAWGLPVFLIRQGIWNWAIGEMVRG